MIPANDSAADFETVHQFYQWLLTLGAPSVYATLEQPPSREELLSLIDAVMPYACSTHCYSNRSKLSPPIEPSLRGDLVRRFRECVALWMPTNMVPEEITRLAREIYDLECGGPARDWDSRPSPMTVEDWLNLEGRRELFDGALVEEERRSPKHDIVVARLFDILRVYAERQGLTVTGPGHKLVASDRIGFLPDITIYAEQDLSRGGPSAKYPIPMLVVEVQSQEIQGDTRNVPHKAMVYANLGVSSFWLLDPDAHVLLCYRPKTDGSSPGTEIHDTGVISPAGFEGLLIDLDGLWAEG